MLEDLKMKLENSLKVGWLKKYAPKFRREVGCNGNSENLNFVKYVNKEGL